MYQLITTYYYNLIYVIVVVFLINCHIKHKTISVQSFKRA